MTSISLKLTLAGVLSLGLCASAHAQSWYPGYTTAQPQYGEPSSVAPQDQADYDAKQQQYQDAQQSYQDQLQHYQTQRSGYDARTQAWRDRREDYDAQRDHYDAARSAYEQQREAYDAQYGPGAWQRRYDY